MYGTVANIVLFIVPQQINLFQIATFSPGPIGQNGMERKVRLSVRSFWNPLPLKPSVGQTQFCPQAAAEEPCG